MDALRRRSPGRQSAKRRASRSHPLQPAVVSLAVLACCCLFGAVASARAASSATVATPATAGTTSTAAAPTAAASPTAALGAALGTPTMTAPRGYVAPLRPTFTWTRVSGAASYELRVYLQLRRGPELLLKKAGLTSLTWRSSVAVPVNIKLTAQVRATGPRGSGPWSGSLGFTVGADGTTNYSSRAHWLALPSKRLKQVDVFYLYPTEYTRPDPSAPIVCAVDDAGMMHGAQVAFQRQVTAFNTVGNIYAPYYRQADAAARAALPQAQQAKIVAGGPTQDGLAAFDYFIRHYDQGRPFILVGHSLGSNVLANLLARYMKARPSVYKRMVAAYVVGYSITPSYLAQNPFLKFATGPSDTGVIVSWNTEAPTVAGTNPVLLPGGLAINPITWTRKQTAATAKQNLGSIELNPATGTPVLNASGSIKRVMGVADARVDKAKGVVICSTIDASAEPYYTPGGFPMGVLHPFDYPFYFFDVRANAANRVEHFFARQ